MLRLIEFRGSLACMKCGPNVPPMRTISSEDRGMFEPWPG